MEKPTMNCEKCQVPLTEEEAVEYGSMTVCDDCAMTLMSPSKACDPWAVKMATGSFETKADAAATLKGLEKQLYDLIVQEGRLPLPQAPQRLGADKEQVQRAFSVLRHMELARGDKGENGGPARKASLRSTDGTVDVSDIARKMGGGGHRRAAGFSTDMSYEELADFLQVETASQLG